MSTEKILNILHKKILKVEEHYSLGSLNPLKAGGMADYSVCVKNTVDLVQAVQGALEAEIPYLVISKGERILFSDGGFPGLVIQNEAKDYAFSLDKTQIVVDSGMPLDQCINLATGQDMAGLVDWYGLGGSIGSNLYHNQVSNGQEFISRLKGATVMMPTSRKNSDRPSIVRHPAMWFREDFGESTLKHGSYSGNEKDNENKPVILSLVLQLTRLRQDEIINRLQKRKQITDPGIDPKNAFGPIFCSSTGWDMRSVLIKAGTAHLRVGKVYPDRYNPNYLRCSGVCSAEEIREMIKLMQDKLGQDMGIEVESRFEFLGVW